MEPAWLPVPAQAGAGAVTNSAAALLLCEELCYCAGALWWGRGGYLPLTAKILGESCAYKRGSLSRRYSQRKCLSVQDGCFCVHLCIPPHCYFICGKCPSLSQQMDLASLVGRIRVVHPLGSSLSLTGCPGA